MKNSAATAFFLALKNALSLPWKSWKAWAVLIVGLLLTALVTSIILLQVQNREKEKFSAECSDIINKIYERLHAHAQVLRCGAALFAVDTQVSRADWKKYIETAAFQRNLPGAQAIEYTLLIPKKDLQPHIQQVRKEGFPQYRVHPEGDREVYSSVLYLEPFSGRNLKAFGYDMLTEPIRCKAMERARDENVASLSGKVLLVQEEGKEVQNGTIMYVPVYQNNMPISTVTERRAALRGWVNSPYRMKDLMQGILREDGLLQDNRIHFSLYDDSISAQSLLYNSVSTDTLQLQHTINLQDSGQIDFNGKKWMLVFDKSENNPFIIRNLAALLWTGGILFSILLFILALSLQATEQRAQDIARNLTLDLHNLSEHLINIREEERTAIAKEIHDRFSQNLVALSMNASWLKNKAVGLKEKEKAILEEQIEIANEVIATSRTLYNELHPAMLDEVGLLETIKWYAHKQLKLTDIRFDCRVEESIDLPYPVRLGLFRIFQEGLTNILQHAQASVIHVFLTKDAQIIRLTIQDNGIGFNEKEKIDSGQSLGLLGIRERVYALKGQFFINSDLGRGTILTVKVPV